MRRRISTTAALTLALILGGLPLLDAQDAPEPTREEGVGTRGLYALFYTTAGSFACRLFEEEAPRNVQNFVELACGYRAWTDPRDGEPRREPYYDGTIIYNVSRNAMIVGGDPLENGLGSPGHYEEDEFHPDLTFDPPARLAMANFGGQRNTNSGTWFVTIAPAPQLTGRNTIIGEVVQGLHVVIGISRAEADRAGRPREEILTERIDIIRVLPTGDVVAYERSNTRPLADLEDLPLSRQSLADVPIWLRERQETTHQFRLPELPPIYGELP